MHARILASSASLALSTVTALACVGCASSPLAPDDETRSTADGSTSDEGPSEKSPTPAVLSDVETVAAFLSGRFDSTAQAARNPQYFGVSLRACPISLGEFAEHVLYVEQAMVDTLESPYRQRVYVLENDSDNRVVSNVFELNTPARHTGLCDDDSVAAPVAEDLVARDGCAVTLVKQDDAFIGGTTGKDCASTLSGASYATSEVTLTSTRIQSWDRGFDAEDVQVWGAVAGPYEFDRKE